MRVIDVLVGATAALPEIRARRFDAMRGNLTKVDNFRFGELFFLARDFCRDRFAVDRKRNENGFAVFSRHTFSAEGDVFDFKIDRAHVINTLLQQGVKREQNSFAQSFASHRPEARC